MKRMSPSSRFVSIAARSAPFSIAGPDVTLICAPSSFAITCASVVLPSPGGPYNKTWSRASFLFFAAVMYTAKFFLIFSCHM